MTSPAKSILIAENDPASRELLAEILRGSGYAVIEAADGNQAVEKLLEARVDLLLVDIQMPGKDGFEVLRFARQHVDPPPPTVALTAHAMRGDREHAIESGFHDYLTKPVEISHLRRRIRELLPE